MKLFKSITSINTYTKIFLSLVIFSTLTSVMHFWFHIEQRICSAELIQPATEPDHGPLYTKGALSFYTDGIYINKKSELKKINYEDSILYYDFKYIIFITSMGIISIIIIIKQDKHLRLARIMSVNNKSDSNTLTLLSENIHHELKTPLLVISRKISKLKKEDLTDKEKDLIESNIDIIYNLLNRMRNFKNTKTDTHKNIYDIATNAFETMQMFQKNNFEFMIDAKLKTYHIKDFTSSDLINNLINHIKNSLEADASRIELHFVNYKNSFVHLQLMDNGNGIPDDILGDVYKENFSTKSSKNLCRGNGMFINKMILNKFGGDENIISSSSEGTSFGIKIPGYIIKV
jgi:K+-sensing histidine kinase KdpD